MDLNIEDNFFYIKNNNLKNSENLNENINVNLHEKVIENFATKRLRAVSDGLDSADEINVSKIDAFKIAIKNSEKFNKISSSLDRFDNDEILKLMKKIGFEDKLNKIKKADIPNTQTSALAKAELGRIKLKIEGEINKLVDNIDVNKFKNSVADVLDIKPGGQIRTAINRTEGVISDLSDEDFNSIVKLKRLIDSNDPTIIDIDTQLKKLYKAGADVEDFDEFFRTHKFGSDIEFKNAARKKYKDMKLEYQKEFCPIRKNCNIKFEKAKKLSWSDDDIAYIKFLRKFKNTFYKNILDEVPLSQIVRKHKYKFGILGFFAVMGIGFSIWQIALEAATGSGDSCNGTDDCPTGHHCQKKDKEVSGSCHKACQDDSQCENEPIKKKCNLSTNLCTKPCSVPEGKTASSSCGTGSICVFSLEKEKESFSSDTNNSSSNSSSNSPSTNGFCFTLCGNDENKRDSNKCNAAGEKGFNCTKKKFDGETYHVCEPNHVDPKSLPCSTNNVIFGIDLFQNTSLTCKTVNLIIISIMVVVLLIFLFLIMKIFT